MRPIFELCYLHRGEISSLLPVTSQTAPLIVRVRGAGTSLAHTGELLCTCVHVCSDRNPHTWRGQSNLWLLVVVFRAYGMRKQGEVNPYSSPTALWPWRDAGPLSLINMDAAWPQGEYTDQLNLVPCKLIEELTLTRYNNAHAYMHCSCLHDAHSLKRAVRHAQTPSIHFSLSQCYQLEARLGCVTLQLYSSGVCEVGCHWHSASNTSRC